MKQRMCLTRGDAMTPPRFWPYKIVDTSRAETIAQLKGKGYIERELSDTEWNRVSGEGCLGDLLDKYYPTKENA